MMARPLYKIAENIIANWPTMNVHAQPYWNAMSNLGTINDHYGADSAKSIVLYFLVNAGSWRGAEARRIKAELNQLVKEAK